MKAVSPASLERLNADAAEAIGVRLRVCRFIAAEQERWKKVLLRARSSQTEHSTDCAYPSSWPEPRGLE